MKANLISAFQFASFHPLEQFAANTIVLHAQLINGYIQHQGMTLDQAREITFEKMMGDKLLPTENHIANSQGMADLAVHFYQFVISTRPEIYRDDIACSCPKCQAKRKAAER